MNSMVTRRTALALSLLILAACTPAPQADPLTEEYSAELCPSCTEWNEPQAPFRVFGNTYYVGTRGLAAILIISPDGHVLIDGGLPNSAPLIQENIGALGFDISEVRLILNSHAHFDHAGGIAALQRASGARVAASGPSAEAIRRGNVGPGDPQHGQLLDFPPAPKLDIFGKLDPTKATEQELRGQELFFGKARCAECHTPPHYTDSNRHDLQLGRFSEPQMINGHFANSEGPIKTFPLRGLKDSPPYFHDGSAATLADVVEHYDTHFGLGLTVDEQADLTEYLKSL